MTGKLQRKPWSSVVLHDWGNCVQSRDGYVAWKLTAEDANLIAAAPELLEALVRVKNLSAEYDFPLSLVIAMNTAIAKAEGHEPELEPHRFT